MKTTIAKAIIGCAMCAMAAEAAAARTIGLDLRGEAPLLSGIPARASSAAAVAADPDGVLRRSNLDAGSADVGDVESGDVLDLTLFDDVSIALTLGKKMPSPLGGDAFLAEAEGYEGVKNAVVLKTPDGLTIEVQDYLKKKVYKVVSTTAGVTVHEIEPKGGTCGCDGLVLPKTKKGDGTGGLRAAALETREASGETFIDVMVAYDTKAAQYAAEQGGITNFATMAVQRMNTALANTGLDDNFLFRLIGIATVAASSADVEQTLYDVTDGTGAWSAVAAAREKCGADIATTLVDTGSAYGLAGIGWMLDSESISELPDNAFNVCAVRAVAQGHTMTHEVGHNLGCGHATAVNPDEIDPGPQMYDFSAGFHFTGTNSVAYHTIMAYNFDGYGKTFTEAPFFSSPSHKYMGTAVGDAKHDNTRTLAATFAEAAQWRTAKASAIEPDPALAIELEWLTSRADAVAAANKKRWILLVSGRDTCANTMYLKNTVCENPAVKPRLASDFVLWYSNCDTQYSETCEYTSGLGSYTLPLVCLLNPNDMTTYKVRSTGFLDLAGFTEILDKVGNPATKPPTKTYYVDAATGSDDNTGLDASTSFATIQRAIDKAENGSEIIVYAGVYGPISSGKELTIRSVRGPEQTIIDASLLWNEGITNRCASLNSYTVLDGFTLINGIANGSTESARSGGGAYLGELLNCTITRCEATYGGGAARCALMNCVLYANKASVQGGGTHYGRMYSCVLEENEASIGGGSYYARLAEDCAYIRNRAISHLDPTLGAWEGGYGGGTSGGKQVRCYYLGNQADCNGGGADDGNLEGCVLVGNKSVGWYGGAASESLLYNCLLDGNEASGYGGGTYRGELRNSTVVNNKISYSKGAGTYDTGVRNCIVWGNKKNGVLEDSVVEFTSATNLYSCCGNDMDGDGNITSDPLFMDAANGDYRLSSGSPCINAGANSLVQGDVDLDGNQRIAGYTVDMGAYEYVGDSGATALVKFDANGGVGGWARRLAPGAALAAPKVTRTGYVFDGWSPSVPSAVPSAGGVYTAKWKANSYTVSFNANGGTGGWTKLLEYGSTFTAPTVTRKGYVFKG